MEMKIEKVGNMVMATTNDVVCKAWMIEEFTEKKYQNFVKKMNLINPSMKILKTF